VETRLDDLLLTLRLDIVPRARQDYNRLATHEFSAERKTMTTETQGYFEIASSLPPAAAVTFHDVSWQEYEQLIEELCESAGLRVSYNQGTLQILTLSPEHESYADFIKLLVGHLSFRLRINIRFFGSATMRSKKKEKGNEPDACFYVQSAPAIGNWVQIDFAVDPPPDVVVEVDIHHDSRDKSSIYAALGVHEIWRYDGQELTMHHLQEDQYVNVERSLALPMLSSSALTDFLARLPKDGESQTLVAFDEWLQTF
jgi:Uma2 family endonuclease